MKTRIQFLTIFSLLFFFVPVFGQEQIDLMGYYIANKKVFSKWEEALKNPDSVFCYVQDPQSMHTLPPTVAKFKELKVLGLGGNVLSDLPKELGLLSNLEELYISENQLYEVPKEIGNLKKLRILLLQYNQLEKLPDNICDCKNLELLDLRKNPIKSLPSCVYSMTHLKELRVYATLIPEQDIQRLQQSLPNTYIMSSW